MSHSAAIKMLTGGCSLIQRSSMEEDPTSELIHMSVGRTVFSQAVGLWVSFPIRASSFLTGCWPEATLSSLPSGPLYRVAHKSWQLASSEQASKRHQKLSQDRGHTLL